MKVMIGQINTTVGDFDGIARRLKSIIAKAKKSHVDLLVFPEMTTTGYPPRDLVERPSFVGKNIALLSEIVGDVTGSLAVVLGALIPHAETTGRGLYNAAVLIKQGKVAHIQPKTLLPTYDVFDESRYFDAAREWTVVNHARQSLGLMVCEDLWYPVAVDGRRLYHVDPAKKLAKQGASVLVNISASPFTVGKYEFRIDLARQVALAHNVDVVYANAVGGNDELVFDGGSFVVNRHGDCVAASKRFSEDITTIDLSSRRSVAVGHMETAEEVVETLSLGLADYVKKCGFNDVVIGLSGGIDSAVVAAIAARALGPDHVLGVAMPSPYSSDHSLRDAKALAQRLGITCREIAIDSMYHAYRNVLAGKNVNTPPDLVDENLQARIRGAILMAISNESGAMVLSTGNKSELAVGYCTMYGDMAGGLALISDVPKMMVYDVARWLNRKKEIIPASIISKAPSAELRPDQKDSDSLPPYDQLDPILSAYVEGRLSPDSIVALGHDREVVARVVKLINQNEYKRRQAALGIKVTSKAFGLGRRFPVAWKG